MSLIFPDQGIPVSIPAGSEKIFAARESDGKIVYFTGAQLFAALLELKTVNGQSLIGAGNITIEGGTMTGGQILTALGVPTLSGTNTGDQDLSGKADLIDGKLNPEQAIDADLAPEQFEQPVVEGVPGNIVIKDSWLTDFIIAVGAAQGWGTGSTQLAAPSMSFGTSTDTQNVINWTAVINATGYVLQALIGATWTTIYTGPLLTYTHSGLTASTNYEYRDKATAPGFMDSPWATGSKSTAGSGGEYIVERRVSLDLQGEFGNDIPAAEGVTWNTWKGDNSDLAVDGLATKTNLVTETGAATTISVVNVGAWNGSNAGSGAATGTRPYPLPAIDGGFTFSSDVGLKFTGANPAKKYQVYVLPFDTDSNAALDIIAGGNTVNVVSTNNLPVGNIDDRYSNAQIAKFYNITPNGSGEFTISFHKTGSHYQATVSLILIEESNIDRP